MGLVYTIAKKVGIALVSTKANKVDIELVDYTRAIKVDIDLVHTRAPTIDIVSFALEPINGLGFIIVSKMVDKGLV